MTWENIGILLGFGSLFGYIVYTICFIHFIRFIAFISLVSGLGEFGSKKDYEQVIIFGSAIFIFSLRSFQKFKIYNPYFARKFLNPFILLFRGGAKAGQFALSVADGTLTGRKQLKRERAEFEREKAFYEGEKRKQQAEWEDIKKAWEELFRERDRWEREKAGGQRKEQKREYKGYKESRQKTEERKKERTGRYFERFARFDLDYFDRNDEYEVLGVKREDNKEIIKKAFYKLQKTYHPDMFNKEDIKEKLFEAEKISKLINFCYEKINK